MTGTQFPLWSIGTANGIESEYDVHWLGWDRAMLTVDGDEVVTFSSANAQGFTTVDSVLDEAGDLVLDIESDGDAWR